MNNVKAAHLKKLIDRFTGKKVLVLGDVMLDEYIWGKVSRISPEAPIPVVHVQRENALPGGAANVANNLRSLGGQVLLAGVVGTDDAARRMTAILKKEGVGTDLLIRDASRPTITKTRVIAHSQQVVRIDREDSMEVSRKVVVQLLEGIERRIKSVDAVIISDYNKGLLTDTLAQGVITLAQKYGKPVTGDPKPENIAKFKHVDLISPNQMEAEKASGIRISNRASLHAAGQAILDMLHCQAVLITRGEEGMSLFEQGGHVSHIPTVAREVYDVSGAGDTVISTLTLCLAAGGNFREAAVAANCAAGITVAEVGVATTTQTELKKRIAEEPWKS
jgi:D-beta-D-heptose 7-phosphate kinase/D-beta-D-heptose 1-phosphate adenosyltransferase